MAYTRLRWVEAETPLSAQNMNNIEDGIEELQSRKVDKVSGKGLSDQNYTATEKTKLAGIEAGAEVNVQSDWNQSDTSADDFIKNKPVNASSSSAGFMSASDKSKLDGIQAGAQVNPGTATTSANGLMSAADKTKLNGVQAGAEVNRTYTAVTGKPTAAASPGFGGTITVSQVSQNANGQVSVTDRVITMPNSDASTSAHGLMSASDKSKLNGIQAGAQANPSNATTSAAGLMSAADKTKLNNIEQGSKSIKSLTLNLDAQVTVSAKGIAYPSFSATGLKGKTIIGYKKLLLMNSDGIAPLVILSWSDDEGSASISQNGVALIVYNPTSSAITLSTVSECTVLYV